jgi:transposase
MIAVPAGMRVLVATKPIDFRKGADGLAALVRETLGHDPFSGTIFVFRAKRADRIKIVAWDGSAPGCIRSRARPTRPRRRRWPP